MKIAALVLTAGIFTSAVSAFSPSITSTSTQHGLSSKSSSSSAFSRSSPASSSRVPQSQSTRLSMLDLSEYAQRDVYAMEEWATQYGFQKAPGVELYTADNVDFQLITQQPIQAGGSVLFVPADIVMNSDAVSQEYGGALQQAEQELVNMDSGTAQRLPLFRLMIRVLAEYEKGADIPFFPWLNSMPRVFYNGVSMTDDCFNCLPPYAGWLASNEKHNFKMFVAALQRGYVPLNSVNDPAVLQWAYNVALTRFEEVWQPSRQKMLTPMADMFNHGTNPNVEVTFDGQGNCNVIATDNIQPGSPLTISLGDPTNPTPIFAQYGFLYDDCKTIFCKAMHLEPQITELGFDFKDLLFQTDSGEISPKVWDVFLYKILQDNDPGAAENFFVAVKTNDEGSKQEYHSAYFQYTLQALKEHVYKILGDVERLSAKAQSYDVQSHPRVPVILQHNNLVQNTFYMTKNALDAMG